MENKNKAEMEERVIASNIETMRRVAELPEEEKIFWMQCVGLLYEDDLPTLLELNEYEMRSLIMDYSQYVQHCYNIGKQPKTIEEFIAMSNIIFNAHLLGLKFEDYVFATEDDENFQHVMVIDTTFGLQGAVMVETSMGDFLPGSIYSAPVKWTE